MFNSINSKSNDNNFNNNYGFCSIDKCLIGKLICDNIEIIDPGNELDDEEFEFISQKNGYSLINPLFNIDTIFQGKNNKIKGKIKTRNSSHELAPSVWRIHFHKKETKETNGIQTRPFSRTLVFVSFVSISKNKRKNKNEKWLP